MGKITGTLADFGFEDEETVEEFNKTISEEAFEGVSGVRTEAIEEEEAFEDEDLEDFWDDEERNNPDVAASKDFSGLFTDNSQKLTYAKLTYATPSKPLKEPKPEKLEKPKRRVREISEYNTTVYETKDGAMYRGSFAIPKGIMEALDIAATSLGISRSKAIELAILSFVAPILTRSSLMEVDPKAASSFKP